MRKRILIFVALVFVLMAIIMTQSAVELFNTASRFVKLGLPGSMVSKVRTQGSIYMVVAIIFYVVAVLSATSISKKSKDSETKT